MSGRYLLGFDVGSSSVKASLGSTDNRRKGWLGRARPTDVVGQCQAQPEKGYERCRR